MKYLIYLFIILGTISCKFIERKPIELKLDESAQKYVIEADLYEGVNDFNVKITKSTSYYDNNKVEYISGATVSITNENGDVTVLNESTSDKGIYGVVDYTATAGENYRLKINFEDGTSTESEAIVPHNTEILSLFFEFQDVSQFNETAGYVPFIFYFDDQEKDNFYRLILTKDGEKLDSYNDLFFFDDELIAKEVVVPYYEVIEKDKEVTIDLVSMNESTFNYLVQINEIIGGTSSAAPANPENNFSGDVLGNFNAYSVSSVTGIAK